MSTPPSAQLLAHALALGARRVAGWSEAEEWLVRGLDGAAPTDWIPRVGNGEDPLGDTFCTLLSPEERRPRGATYTPAPIVTAMIDWARRREPVRVVDPGVGSARFLVAAGRAFPDALLLGVDDDPYAAILARGHLAAAGLADRAEIRVQDYRTLTLAPVTGPTLFVGNPPYVRHHDIAADWKAWLTREAHARGLHASQLAGLHVHFFLATARLARPGDYGAFITAAEWMDVNYGALVRELFAGALGGRALTLIEPTARPFPDAASTAAIACFEVGSAADVRVQRVDDLHQLGTLEGADTIERAQLQASPRWTPLTRGHRRGGDDMVELGELCRVHRGQVTGANQVWIAGAHAAGLPTSILRPTITRAKELFAAGASLDDLRALKRVIDLPADLDELPTAERRVVERFLEVARRMGADTGYIASKRRAWWAVHLREPAPILATYMARRPPAFVRNPLGARHINIAHGLYPREAMAPALLDALAAWLRRGVAMAEGRTYAGGLTKFEPREMERIRVPTPERLLEGR